MATAIGRRWSRLKGRVPFEPVGMLVGGLVATLLAVYLHELAHLSVYAQYGCGSSVHWLPVHGQHFAVARPDPSCWQSLSAAQRRELSAAQLMVESVGYQLVPLYGLLGAMAGFVVASDRGS